MGGLETSSDELHPLLLLEVGGGVVQERTICETPAAKAVGAAPNIKTSTITITPNLAIAALRTLLREHTSAFCGSRLGFVI